MQNQVDFLIGKERIWEMPGEKEIRKNELIMKGGKADLKEIDRIAKKVGGLSRGQRELLHRLISKQKLSLEEIEELAKQIKDLYPNK